MRFLPFRSLRGIACTASLITICASVALAHHYRLGYVSTPTAFLRAGRVDREIEPAGIAPIDISGRAIVVDETTGALRIVDVSTGAYVGAPLACLKPAETSAASPTWRGLALDSAGNRYMLRLTRGESAGENGERFQVVRFRLRSVDPLACDEASIACWDLTRPLEDALRTAGLGLAELPEIAVGGLTVREAGGRRELVIGVTAPDRSVRAYSANISNPPATGAELKLRPVFAFDAGACEGVPARLASLEYAPLMGGFLVVTTSVDRSNVFHGNTLHLVANGERRKATAYATFEVAMKAAGLTVLGVKTNQGETEIALLIAYDNDPRATKMPSRLQRMTLVHPSR